MENEKINVVLNEILVNKLEIISFDIKHYLNTYASMAETLDEETINIFKFIDSEEFNELIEIRKKNKILAQKLKKKLKNNNLN